jgi:putative endonuclease
MPSRGTRRSLGNFGEAAAAAHLTRQGYVVLERQWRCAYGELDLVARQGEQLVFVEVRTRKGSAYGSAEESITTSKQQRLVTLAYAYMEAHSLDPAVAWRIDVIAVEMAAGGRIGTVRHIVNAVEESA